MRADEAFCGAGLVVFTAAVITMVLGALEWAAVAVFPAVIIIVSAVWVWILILLIWWFIDPDASARSYQQIV